MHHSGRILCHSPPFRSKSSTGLQTYANVCKRMQTYASPDPCTLSCLPRHRLIAHTPLRLILCPLPPFFSRALMSVLPPVQIISNAPFSTRTASRFQPSKDQLFKTPLPSPIRLSSTHTCTHHTFWILVSRQDDTW